MRNVLKFSAIAICLATAAPAHAGSFWRDLGSKISSMFSGAGISNSEYSTKYFGTTTQPIAVSNFPSGSAAARADLYHKQQVRANQINVSNWLLTGEKTPPKATTIMQSTSRQTAVRPQGRTNTHGTGTGGTPR